MQFNGPEHDALKRAAKEAYDSGLCVLPPAMNGTKKPIESWKQFQENRPEWIRVERWIEHGTGLGVLCGAVSGGLELFEFDDHATYVAYVSAAKELGLADLVERIESGYLEQTPAGGVHWFYRNDELRGNTKLARRPGDGQTVKVLIETRGEGGFAVTAPSYGPVHPTKNPYQLLRGGFATIATITGAERDTLWNLARTFDETPADAGQSPETGDRAWQDEVPAGGRPGDEFNARAKWADVLDGWTLVLKRGNVCYWRRPGRDHGWSATTGWGTKGGDWLYVFSTSTVLPSGRGLSKFAVYAYLKHNGDFAAAARALANRMRAPRNPGRNGAAADRPAGGAPVAAGRPEPGRSPLTDLGNAERLVARRGRWLRFCHPWGKWLVWDGKRWKVDDVAKARVFCKEMVRAILTEAANEPDDEELKKIARWAFQSEARDRVVAALFHAQAEPGIPILPEEMDSDPWLFNCANGTIDLRSGTLRPHRREDMITKLCPVDFDPDAAAPHWNETLNFFFGGNPRLIAYWKRICGYAMVGLVRDHVMPIAYGGGANGKSTILGALLDMFGTDYGMKCDPNMLMVRKNEQHSTERMDLFGKRLVVAIETEEGRRLNETQVKELTGGDPIRGRRMREDSWEFRPSHTLIMATNHKPRIRGTDKGIWRRLKLVPFNVTVDEATADMTMPEKLRGELPGILRWAVDGCLDWQECGLDEPNEVLDATEDYREGEDVLGDFIEEWIEFDTQAELRASELYAAYAYWAKSLNEHPLSSKAVGQALIERGVKRRRSMGIIYIGMRLKKEIPREQRDFLGRSRGADA